MKPLQHTQLRLQCGKQSGVGSLREKLAHGRGAVIDDRVADGDDKFRKRPDNMQIKSRNRSLGLN